MAPAAAALGCALLLALSAVTAHGAIYPAIEASPSPANAGNFQLKWSAENRPVVLQGASSPEFTDPVVIYEGTDGASVISGLPDGDYYFRVRFADGVDVAWSPPLRVLVAHHSLAKALSFFTVGALVFVATIALIFTGSRRARSGVVRG